MSHESSNPLICSYHSSNGGLNWHTEIVPPPTGLQFQHAHPWSDPSVAHDHQGRVYVAFNLREDGRDVLGSRDAIVVARYREDIADRAPFYESIAVTAWIDSNVDKPFLEVDDNPSSPGAGNIYVAWTDINPIQTHNRGLYIAKSTDRGVTWTNNRIAPFYASSIHAVDLAIGPRGEVYAVWQTRESRKVGAVQRSIVNIRTKNLGIALSNPNSQEQVVVRTNNFLLPDPPIPAVGRLDAVLPLPSIDVDRSGSQNNGRVWIAFADYLTHYPPPTPPTGFPPKNMNIYVTWSDNEGASWSFPVQINQDHTLTSQFHPWLDVDDVDGSVGVIYYSTQSDPTHNKGVRVMYAQFTRGDAADEQSWSNSYITNSASNVDRSTCSTCYREYIGLHKRDHAAYLAWTSLHTGEPEIFFVRFLDGY